MIVGDLILFSDTFNLIKNHLVTNEIITDSVDLDMDDIEDIIMSSDYIRSYYYTSIMTYFFEFKISREINSLSFSVNCVDSPEKEKLAFPDFGATFDLFTESKRQIKINSFVSFTVAGNYSWKYIPSVQGIVNAEGYLPVFGKTGIEQRIIPPDNMIYSMEDFKNMLDPIHYRQSLKIIQIEK
ncbi:MAG: hypothetical protein JW982_13775 [Spirochaetes bacterium]|nr:hypothetical protein [Spirochaetota bacterium]